MTNQNTLTTQQAAAYEHLLSRLMKHTGWPREKAARWISSHFSGKRMNWELILRELRRDRARTAPGTSPRPSSVSYSDEPDEEPDDGMSL